MLQQAIILSLQITAIYILFNEGNLLSFVRVFVANKFDKWFGKHISILVQKPLWECLCCMSSFWTIALTGTFNIGFILLVCGINCIIYNLFFNENTDLP